jgi:hypothetical protein
MAVFTPPGSSSLASAMICTLKKTEWQQSMSRKLGDSSY